MTFKEKTDVIQEKLENVIKSLSFPMLFEICPPKHWKDGRFVHRFKLRAKKSNTLVKVSLFEISNYLPVSVVIDDKNYFFLEDYLKHLKLPGREHLEYVEGKQDFGDFAIAWQELLKHLFETELKDILLGQRWVEIPFDFSDVPGK